MPEVLELIADRRAGRSDSHVLAVALEGGGMRGVVSGALLIALRELGVDRVVDRWYGTSSGSLNLAYFAAGHGWDALTIYYDHLVRGFVRSAGPGRPPVVMARLDEVIRREIPLRTDALAGSRVDARIVQTDVARREPVIVRLREVVPAVHENLLAGAWLPVLAGGPYLLDGQPRLDGGLLWPDPLYAALAEGATHVLVIGTAPAGRPAGTALVTSRLLAATLDRWSSGLGPAYLAGRRRWDRDRSRLVPGQDTVVDGAAVVRLQPPPADHRVQRLTTDRSALLDGARSGYRLARTVFGVPGPVAFSLVGV